MTVVNAKKIIFLFLLFHPFLSTVAQEKYQVGFIETSEGQRVDGFVSIRTNLQNSRSCSFKESENSEVQRFKPFEIMAYGVDEEHYFASRYVDIYGKKEAFFLEYLVDGISDLFYLPGNDENDLYFLEKNDSLYQLSNYEVQIQEENGLYTYNSNKYKGYLKYLMQDASSLAPQINRINFNRTDLIKLTVKYHELTCDEYECEVFTGKTEKKFFLEPTVGFPISRVHDYNSRTDELDFVEIDMAPSLGLNASIHFPKKNYSLSIRTGVQYSMRNVSFSGVSNTGVLSKLSQKYHFITIPFLLEKTLSSGKWKFAINGGLMSFIVIGQVNERIGRFDQINFTIEENSRPTNAYFSLPRIGLGFYYSLKDNSYVRFVVDSYFIGGQGTLSTTDLVFHPSIGYNFMLKSKKNREN